MIVPVETGYFSLHGLGKMMETLEVLRENYEHIGLVISDWEMPKLQGIDLLKRIRSDDDLSGVPFLMCTSQTSIERIKLTQAIEAQVVDQTFHQEPLTSVRSFAVVRVLVPADRAEEARKLLAAGTPLPEDGESMDGGGEVQ